MREIEADNISELMQQLWGEPLKFPVRVKISENIKQRTSAQNRALHLYFTLLSNDLNECGWTVSGLLKVIERLGEVPWTDDLVKELIWARYQLAMLKTNSTRDLTTDQVSKVYETLSMNMAKIAGVSTPFPDRYGPLD